MEDFKPNKKIKFKTSMLRSDLCDYSEAYVMLKEMLMQKIQVVIAILYKKFCF